jgi:glutathione S-transferase
MQSKGGLFLQRDGKQFAQTAWSAADDNTLADINFYAKCGMTAGPMFPELAVTCRYSRVLAWRERLTPCLAVARAPAGEARTAPALRTYTGHAR